MFKLIRSSKVLALGVGSAVLAVASSASAALSVDQQAAVDSITLMITDFGSWAWTAVIALVAVTIGIKLFKKFTGKGT
jgi:hypothetical protein